MALLNTSKGASLTTAYTTLEAMPSPPPHVICSFRGVQISLWLNVKDSKPGGGSGSGSSSKGCMRMCISGFVTDW